MRIAHVITGLGVGGAERVLLDLCGELSEAGHQVVVWSLTADVDAVMRGVDSRVRIETLGITRNPLTWLFGCFQFIAGVRRFGAEVIHAHLFHALLLGVTAKILSRGRLSLVFTSHSYSIHGGFRRFFLRRTRRFRDADVTFGPAQHRDLNCDNVAVIANGIPVSPRPEGREPIVPGTRPWRFINVGRFTEPKGHLRLLVQFARVIECGVDAELWLVGDGPLRGEIEMAAQRLKIASQVKLLGRRTDVEDLLIQSDVFVLSSKWEGLPIAVLEAGLAELPVISTSVGSVPILLSDRCGILANENDLSQAMCDVVARYEESIELGKRLGARIKADYSVRAMAEAHARLYAGLACKGLIGTLPSD